MKKILGLAVILVFAYACVPAVTDVKSQKEKDIKDMTTGAIQAPKTQEKSDQTKSSAEKNEPSGSKKGDKEPNRDNQLKKVTLPPPKIEKKLSDEDKVKKAALEVIKELGSPIKYIICYDQEKDEWSLTVYDDIGNVLDVKQYFWNIEKEKLEPFLVLNRIPKSRLGLELSKSSVKKKCSTYDPH
jgi:hypothetical protein